MKALVIVVGVLLGLGACVLIYLPFIQKRCPFCKKKLPRQALRCTHCFAKLPG